MTNLEALEKLYISLGGVESDLEGVNTTAEVIELIKDVAGGGGSGGGALRVNYTEEGATQTLDHTFAEIRDAYFNGQNVYLYIPDSEVTEDWDILTLTGMSKLDAYTVFFGTNYQYDAQSPDDYPTANLD